MVNIDLDSDVELMEMHSPISIHNGHSSDSDFVPAQAVKKRTLDGKRKRNQVVQHQVLDNGNTNPKDVKEMGTELGTAMKPVNSPQLMLNLSSGSEQDGEEAKEELELEPDQLSDSGLNGEAVKGRQEKNNQRLARSKLDELLEKEASLRKKIADLEEEIAAWALEYGQENNQEQKEEFQAPLYCVPIKANVMDFEWDKLANACQFDVITMDPPWQLASQAPTRGVAIAYQQLPDVCIESLPIHKLQNEGGFLFIWVINNKFSKAFELFRLWGYTFIDDVTWVKQTVNRRMAKGHGYYLQHAKETCLVGVKNKSGVQPEFVGTKQIPHPQLSEKFYQALSLQNQKFEKRDDLLEPKNVKYNIGSDVIFSERRGQSQKPEDLYQMIEQLVPGGKYLEIFGRKNNLRDYWVTIGNEL